VARSRSEWAGPQARQEKGRPITAALDLTQLQPLTIAIALLLVALMLTTPLLTALAGILRLLTGLLLAALMLLSALIWIVRHVFLSKWLYAIGQRSGSRHVPISFCFYLVIWLHS
jgi:hypothetical protein